MLSIYFLLVFIHKQIRQKIPLLIYFKILFFAGNVFAQKNRDLVIERSITISSGYRFVHFHEKEPKFFNYNGVKQIDILSPSFSVFQFGAEFSSNRKKCVDVVGGFKAEIYSYKYLHIALNPNIYYGQGGLNGPYDYLDSIFRKHHLLSVNIPLFLSVNPFRNSKFKLITGFSIDLYCYVITKQIYHRAYEYYQYELQGSHHSLQPFFHEYAHSPRRANLSYIFKPRFTLNSNIRKPMTISPFFNITLLQQFGRSGQGNDKYVSGLRFLHPLKYNLITFGVELTLF